MGNNYTMTTPNQTKTHDLLTWEGLHESKYAFDTKFKVQMADGQEIFANQVIRVIPKRRIVAFGTWNDQPVFVKFFIDSKRAKLHMQNDVQGVKILMENKVPTPALLYQGVTKDERIHVVVYERIFDVSNLEEVWKNRKSNEEAYPILQAVVTELATQHVLGVMQNDLYFKNFLIAGSKVYTVDGAEIEICPQSLPRKTSMYNLARLLSQFGVGFDDYKQNLFKHYATARGWILKEEDYVNIALMIKHRDEYRRSRYESKIFRECTDFSRIKKWHSFAMLERGYAAPEFMRFIYNPELAFNHPTTQILKDGGSSTVVRVKLDDRDLVVKRYNLKNIRHKLRRSLRATRAAHSWRVSKKMSLFGIATAKPIAFVDKRFFALRGKSYLIMDYIPGENMGEYFVRENLSVDAKTNMVDRIAALLKNLAKLDVTHGDLKSTNILIDKNEQPVLIDFDGTQEHVNQSSLRTAWQKEIKRFLRNFENLPEIHQQFVEKLAE